MTARMEDDELEVTLLERYCSGTASAGESARIEAWFEAYPERRGWYERLREELRRPQFVALSTEERQVAWAEVIRLALQRRPVVAESVRPAVRLGRHVHVARRRRGWRSVVSAAAGTAAAVALVLVGRSAVRSSGGAHAAPVTTYTTHRGERADITLPDGSTVTLNVASRLQVPVDFAAAQRTVTLQGEALFHVARHTGAPFTVMTGETPTRVLGTTFLVRRYPTDTATTVAVRDGKVAVRSVVVAAHQQVTANVRGAARPQPADPSQFSFVTGVLTLNGLPMPQAVVELDRWYDADIRFGDDAVRNHVLDATFIAGSLSDLADVLTLALNVQVVRHGRVLTLYTR